MATLLRAPAPITVTPLTPVIGAEIGGVDLTAPLTEATADALARALDAHLVIFFRDQPVSFEDMKRLGRAFGDLHIHSGVAGLPDHPDVVRIHADGGSRFVAGEDWHSDLTCDPVPPMGSILYLHTVPDTGGDTAFASMYAAYDGLSDRMKAHLDGLFALHDGARVFAAFSPPGKTFPKTRHPVIRTHPRTGRKAIFVNKQFTAHIEGLPRDESDALLAYLHAHCAKLQYQARFRWRPHSIAFWDNRCAQHSAIWDYFPHVRSGYRVTVAGDEPF
ncbi:MAG: TauD/TfdA family dioxygenase [Sphingomonas sp.]